jgi:magnesium transporter
VLLSALLRRPVVDAAGRRADLRDLAIDLAAGDHPPVTGLRIRRDGERCHLPWEAVVAVEPRAVRVADLATAAPVDDPDAPHPVLLRSHVLDALVIDLENHQTARANDLWLREEGGRMHLAGADLSAWALLRRLLPWSREARQPAILDWACVEFLRGDPAAAREGRDYHRRIARLLPADIAQLLDAMPYLHAAELLTILPDETAADVLELMNPDRQLQVAEELPDDQAERLIAFMAPDGAADLLGRLPPDVAERRLGHLPIEQRERLISLLRYPPDTAGGVMTNDLVVATVGPTVGEARRALKEQLGKPDFVYYVYVVEDLEGARLRGVLTLRDLLVADDSTVIDELMDDRIETVSPDLPAREAAHRVADRALAALPVVDADGRLLGAITADAALEQLAPTALRDQVTRVFS